MAAGVRYIPSSWQQDIFEVYPIVKATGLSYVPLLWQYAWVHFRNIPFLVNSMWVIPYHFTKLLHMTPSELNGVWVAQVVLCIPKEFHVNCLYGFQEIPY